jgi:hypothetical protein
MARRVVSHADAHSHVANLVPTTHFIGRLLRFEIEVNNILRVHFEVRSLSGKHGGIAMRKYSQSIHNYAVSG